MHICWIDSLVDIKIVTKENKSNKSKINRSAWPHKNGDHRRLTLFKDHKDNVNEFIYKSKPL